MCKHVLNAQVSIRSPCCKKWFDCPKCHEESQDHELTKTTEMVFACKKCKKVFRKNMLEFEEADEYCPHCDNHFIIDAETPETKAIKEGKGQLVIGVDGGDMTDEMREQMLAKMLAEDDDVDLTD